MIDLPESLKLTPARDTDQASLQALFRSARPHLEQVDLPPELALTLVQQQYRLQQVHYRERWPQHQVWLVERLHKVIGKMAIDESSSAIRLIDLVLFPEHRGQGVGATLIKALQAAAQAKNLPIELSVDRQNPRARALYLSLGFYTSRYSETQEDMKWHAGKRSPATSV